MVTGRNTPAHRMLPLWLCAGLVSFNLYAATPDDIEAYRDEGGSTYQAITEIKLENGKIVTVIYSKGNYQGSDAATPRASDISPVIPTISTMTNPQMGEYFIPGLFGLTAAGGPAVDQNLKVTQSSLRAGTYDASRDPEQGSAINTSLTVQQSSGVRISQDFLPKNAHDYHATSHSR